MPFSTFEEMFKFYKRRNIFNQHDYQMVMKGDITDNDAFIEKIARPKLFQGRINWSDYLRILATIL